MSILLGLPVLFNVAGCTPENMVVVDGNDNNRAEETINTGNICSPGHIESGTIFAPKDNPISSVQIEVQQMLV